MRDVCGEHIIVADDKENIDLCNIIGMNDTSAYLWKSVQDADFNADTLVKLLVAEYEIGEEDARKDVNDLLVQWQQAGIVE